MGLICACLRKTRDEEAIHLLADEVLRRLPSKAAVLPVGAAAGSAALRGGGGRAVHPALDVPSLMELLGSRLEDEAPASDGASGGPAAAASHPLVQRLQPPRWLPDEGSDSCFRCDAAFTFTRRRHHCRRCGTVHCDACAKNRVRMAATGKFGRVCDRCFAHIAAENDFVDAALPVLLRGARFQRRKIFGRADVFAKLDDREEYLVLAVSAEPHRRLPLGELADGVRCHGMRLEVRADGGEWVLEGADAVGFGLALRRAAEIASKESTKMREESRRELADEQRRWEARRRALEDRRARAEEMRGRMRDKYGLVA